MTESFDAYEYAVHLRSNWRFISIVCGVAVALALAASLLLPKKYTATARIVIEPPGGIDQRTAVAVSPIYLESLKTYEHFASSDSLFLRALEHLGLREHAGPVESFKRSVLRVDIPRSTKILEIAVTLRDPKKAQALASYLAQETVRLSSSITTDADRQLTEELDKQVNEARKALDRARAEWNRAAATEPVEGLSDQIISTEMLRTDLSRDISNTEIAVAENAARDPAKNGDDTRATAARLRVLKSRSDALDRELSHLRAVYSERAARQDTLSAQRKDAEAALASAENRLREGRAAAGSRAEHLTIIDPGITPERPSSPSIPLNVIAAFLLGLTISIVYLSFQFGIGRGKRPPALATLRSIARNE